MELGDRSFDLSWAVRTMTAKVLSSNPGGFAGSQPYAESALWKQICRIVRKDSGHPIYVRGHLLNHHLHGPGSEATGSVEIPTRALESSHDPARWKCRRARRRTDAAPVAPAPRHPLAQSPHHLEGRGGEDIRLPVRV
jgi:hypothetical protein